MQEAVLTLISAPEKLITASNPDTTAGLRNPDAGSHAISSETDVL